MFNDQAVTRDSYPDKLQSFVVDNHSFGIITSGSLQQDGASTHYSLAVRYYQEDFVINLLEQLDFWLGQNAHHSERHVISGSVMMKERVYTTRPSDINDFKELITIVVRSAPKKMCERAIACMVKRLHTYIGNPRRETDVTKEHSLLL